MRKYPNRYVCLDCGSKNLGLGICKEEKCERAVHGRGWCKYHYDRWWKYGDPQMPDQRKARGDSLLDNDSFWEGVDRHTKERLNVA